MRADEAAAVSVAQEEPQAAEAAAIAEQRSWIEAAIAEGRAEAPARGAAVGAATLVAGQPEAPAQAAGPLPPLVAGGTASSVSP